MDYKLSPSRRRWLTITRVYLTHSRVWLSISPLARLSSILPHDCLPSLLQNFGLRLRESHTHPMSIASRVALLLWIASVQVAPEAVLHV